MKVSLLLFAGLGAAARGHDGPLRGSGSAASAPDEHRLGSDSGYSGLTLMLDRVRAGETESDDVVIGAIVDSYNKFHSGYSVVSAFKDEEIVIPVVDADGAYTDVLARYTVGWTCSSCADDEGMLPPLQLQALTGSEAHEKFVDDLCKALRESGKPAYEGITKCSVDFTYGTAKTQQLAAEAARADGSELGWPWGRKKDDKPADKSGIPMGAEIDIHHVFDAGDTDFGALSKMFIDAYNEVHADTPYRITSFAIDQEYSYADPDSDWTANFTVNGDGDSEIVDGEGHRRLCRCRSGRRCSYTCDIGRGWRGRGDFGCTMCRDERSVLPPLAIVAARQYKENRMKVTEKLFCHKLAKMDDPPYRDVRDCKISLVTPDEDSRLWFEYVSGVGSTSSSSSSSSAAATDLA